MGENPDQLYTLGIIPSYFIYSWYQVILILLLLLCRHWCVVNSGARHHRVLVLWKVLDQQSSGVSRSQPVEWCHFVASSVCTAAHIVSPGVIRLAALMQQRQQ